MKKINKQKLADFHNSLWRDPSQVIGQEPLAFAVNKRLLEFKIKGPFWDILRQLKSRLVVSREYEHFVLMLGASRQGPEISYMPLPHPSGIAIDHSSKEIFIAASRNPNQVYTFQDFDGCLLPVKTNFYPGNLYIHDLAMIKGSLYANAVGHNAVVQLAKEGGYRYAWWPKCVQDKDKPLNDRNYLQLNSISGGESLNKCFFTATCGEIGPHIMGAADFPVDGRGVVFSGSTGQPVCHGLTRPHSARIYKNKIWLNNSGYGQVGYVENGRFQAVMELPGWTRGLGFIKDMAIVGVSRLLPRFTQYAPGLQIKKCVCAVMLIDLKSTKILASIQWPYGNQIFSVESLNKNFTSRFINVYRPHLFKQDIKGLFYKYSNQIGGL